MAHVLWLPAMLQLALRIHHHIRGPRGGYAGLGLAAAASWIGLPGPGEAALVAAGVLAAHRQLDLLSVLVTGWAGATIGGTGGWLIGRFAGRRVLTAPGPLAGVRRSAVARGDRLYERYGPIAVFFSPSWAAGLAGMRVVAFLVANTLSALVWAAALGAGSYVAGPAVLDLFADVGLVGGIALGIVLAVGVVGGVARRQRAH